MSSTATITPAGTVRALIDIGTNSVKLLVADVLGHEIRPLHEESEQTRLGKGFYDTHLLQAEAVQDTGMAVARFAARAAEWRPSTIRVIATSAARDAQNQDLLLETVRRISGLRVEVISGEQEAEWVYQGVTSDPTLAGQRLLILDVGGGSTEFILGDGQQKQFRESFPLGSVRLMEQLQPRDPPPPPDLDRCRATVAEFIRTRVVPDVGSAMRSSGGAYQLIGTGGASTIMGRILYRLDSFERSQLEGAQLKLPQVRGLVDRLWSLPLAERKRIIGLPKKRADVILTGSAIYEGVMEQLGFAEMRISTRGLRFGGLLDP